MIRFEALWISRRLLRDISVVMDKSPGLLRRGSLNPEGTLREIQINLLECKVCFETFSFQQGERRPQNLSCGHVLCLECVTALSHPLLRKLECPFCRQLCSADSTSHCRVLSDLQELLLSQRPSSSAAAPPLCRTKEGSPSATGLHLRTVFGGWGTLVNPTGIAALGSSGAVAVVHDGAKRVVVFNQQGRKLNSFGRRGEATGDICYPVDVAVTPTGCVVVTDAGAKAVKVFTSRGNHMAMVKGSFQMPWGVDTNRDGHILVSDVQAGTLSLVKVDYGHGVVLECRTVISNLQRPKAVACCQVAGNIAVMEHPTERHHQHRKLKVFTKDFHLLYQMDSFSLNLQFGLRLNMSGLAFDRDGEDVLLTDSDQGLVCRLGKLQDDVVLAPLVGSHLVQPVGLVALNNTFIILDGGDHSVKIYSV